MSIRSVRRPRTVSVGDGTQVEGHRVLAGGAQICTGASGGAEATHDPLVLALVQLVRDRWAAEQADHEKPVALRSTPRNMVTMTVQRRLVEESSA
jgi:hypothetical protein